LGGAIAPPVPDGLQNTTFARSALGTASIGAASIDAAEQVRLSNQTQSNPNHNP